MDDATLVTALNNITSAVGLLAALTPSGAPDTMRLLNAAKNLYDPPPVAAPKSDDPPADPAPDTSATTTTSSRSRSSS